MGIRLAFGRKERLQYVYDMREQGMSFREIAESMPNMLRGGIGISEAVARQLYKRYTMRLKYQQLLANQEELTSETKHKANA